MRLHRLLVPLGCAFAFASCGSSSSSGGDAGPSAAVPKGTLVYVEGAVRPEGDQGDAARALLDRFLPSGTTLESLLDDAIRKAGDDATYARDIKPWLGERLGVGVLDIGADEPTYIGAVQATDTDKAAAFLGDQGDAKGSYQDFKLFQEDGTWAGAGDGLVVFAETQANLKKGIDAAGGDGLDDAKTFTDAVGKLPDERLGTLFVDLEGLKALAAKDPDFGPQQKAVLDKLLGEEKLSPLTAALTARSDSATIESRFASGALTRLSSLGLLGGTSTDLVKDAPADAWAVYGQADVGTTIATAIDTFAGALGGAALTGQLEAQTGVNLQRDLLSWMGDVSVFVRGTTQDDLTGAMTVSVTDQAAARAAVPRLVAAAKRVGAPVQGASVDGADQAFSVAVPGAPGPVVLAQGGDRVVLAFGERAAGEALSPQGDTLADSGRYDDAKDAIDGVEPALIVSVPEVLALAASSGATDDPDYAKAKPYLEQLDLAVAGSEKDGDQLRSLFTVTTK